MGCDIHGPWVFGTREASVPPERLAELHWDRDYLVFGIVAGVRDESAPQIDLPRGFPGDILDGYYAWNLKPGGGRHDECEAPHEHAYGDDCHSASWLSTDEVVEAQLRYTKQAFLEDALNAQASRDLAMTIAFMRTAEQMGYTDVRICFCFDS